jgi:hypothetical protein
VTAENTPLDAITAGTRNAELAFDLLQAQLANPELLNEIPNGATVVLIPEDDPALAEYNFGVARALIARGKNVYLKRVLTAAPAPTP